MSLVIQPATPGAPQVRPGALPTVPVVAAPGVFGLAEASGTGTGTVAFSPAAVLLAQLQSGAAGTAPALPAPGSEQATAMTMLLAQRMGVLLRDAGLPAGPALAFEVGGDDRVRVASSRPDAAQVQALVDAQPDVQMLVRVLQAISAAPIAALAAAALPAPEPRGTDARIDAATVAPGPPPFHPWAWWGTRPARRATHAVRRARLVWLAAAALAILGLLLWRW